MLMTYVKIEQFSAFLGVRMNNGEGLKVLCKSLWTGVSLSLRANTIRGTLHGD